MSEGRVTFTKTGPIGAIVFDRPGAHNALSMTMWRQIAAICREIAADGDLRAVTLRGAGGKAFVSGTDIEGFLKFKSGADGLVYEREMDETLGLVEALPVPTVALVEGWAVGGGIALAFACDFRIAATNAKFGSPIGRTIGNCLSAKSYARLLAHVGMTQAKRIVMLGEILSAQECLNLGLLLSVVEPDALDTAGAALCEKILANAPLTARASKEALRRIAYANVPDISDLIDLIYGSADFQQAVRDFLQKKKPVWRGR